MAMRLWGRGGPVLIVNFPALRADGSVNTVMKGTQMMVTAWGRHILWRKKVSFTRWMARSTGIFRRAENRQAGNYRVRRGAYIVARGTGVPPPCATLTHAAD